MKKIILSLILLAGILPGCTQASYEGAKRFFCRTIFNFDPHLEKFAKEHPGLKLDESFSTGCKENSNFKRVCLGMACIGAGTGVFYSGKYLHKRSWDKVRMPLIVAVKGNNREGKTDLRILFGDKHANLDRKMFKFSRLEDYQRFHLQYDSCEVLRIATENDLINSMMFFVEFHWRLIPEFFRYEFLRHALRNDICCFILSVLMRFNSDNVAVANIREQLGNDVLQEVFDFYVHQYTRDYLNDTYELRRSMRGPRDASVAAFYRPCQGECGGFCTKIWGCNSNDTEKMKHWMLLAAKIGDKFIFETLYKKLKEVGQISDEDCKKIVFALPKQNLFRAQTRFLGVFFTGFNVDVGASSNAEVIKGLGKLLPLNSKVNWKGSEGWNLIELAIKCKNDTALNVFLPNLCDSMINKKASGGLSLIESALKFKNFEAVKKLLTSPLLNVEEVELIENQVRANSDLYRPFIQRKWILEAFKDWNLPTEIINYILSFMCYDPPRETEV